jgi:hypothetical protein
MLKYYQELQASIDQRERTTTLHPPSPHATTAHHPPSPHTTTATTTITTYHHYHCHCHHQPPTTHHQPLTTHHILAGRKKDAVQHQHAHPAAAAAQQHAHAAQQHGHAVQAGSAAQQGRNQIPRTARQVTPDVARHFWDSLQRIAAGETAKTLNQCVSVVEMHVQSATPKLAQLRTNMLQVQHLLRMNSSSVPENWIVVDMATLQSLPDSITRLVDAAMTEVKSILASGTHQAHQQQQQPSHQQPSHQQPPQQPRHMPTPAHQQQPLPPPAQPHAVATAVDHYGVAMGSAPAAASAGASTASSSAVALQKADREIAAVTPKAEAMQAFGYAGGSGAGAGAAAGVGGADAITAFAPFRVPVTDEEMASTSFHVDPRVRAAPSSLASDDDDDLGKSLVAILSWSSGEGDDQRASKRSRAERTPSDGGGDLCHGAGRSRDEVR